MNVLTLVEDLGNDGDGLGWSGDGSQQQNQRRWASYRLVGDSPQSSLQSLADSPQRSPQSPVDSPHSAHDSPQSAAAVPANLHELLPLAEPARSRKRLPAAEMRSVIEQLCMGRWLTTSEIAILVSREAEKLQSRFLTAMVREGRLKHRYPDVPNRPDQAYRTVSPTE